MDTRLLTMHESTINHPRQQAYGVSCGNLCLLPLFVALECVLCILKRNGNRGRARFIATTMKSGICTRKRTLHKKRNLHMKAEFAQETGICTNDERHNAEEKHFTIRRFSYLSTTNKAFFDTTYDDTRRSPENINSYNSYPWCSKKPFPRNTVWAQQLLQPLDKEQDDTLVPPSLLERKTVAIDPIYERVEECKPCTIDEFTRKRAGLSRLSVWCQTCDSLGLFRKVGIRQNMACARPVVPSVALSTRASNTNEPVLSNSSHFLDMKWDTQNKDNT